MKPCIFLKRYYPIMNREQKKNNKAILKILDNPANMKDSLIKNLNKLVASLSIDPKVMNSKEDKQYE